jgi:hypothetical protein
MSDALPCPFCGAPPERPQNSDAAGCNFHAGWLPLSEWNRRAGETHLRAQVEALRGALEPFAKAGRYVSEGYERDIPDNSPSFATFTIGDLRRASQANGSEG